MPVTAASLRAPNWPRVASASATRACRSVSLPAMIASISAASTVRASAEQPFYRHAQRTRDGRQLGQRRVPLAAFYA